MNDSNFFFFQEAAPSSVAMLGVLRENLYLIQDGELYSLWAVSLDAAQQVQGLSLFPAGIQPVTAYFKIMVWMMRLGGGTLQA